MAKLRKEEHPRPSLKMKETLSPAEEQFERWRNTLGIFLGPLVAILLW